MQSRPTISEQEAQSQYGIDFRLLRMPDGRYVLHKGSKLLWQQAEYLILTRSFSYDALVHLAHQGMERHDVGFTDSFSTIVAYFYECALEYDGKTPKHLTA